MLLRRSPLSLQGRASVAVYCLLLLLVLRSISVGLTTWVGRHDASALNALGAMHADVLELGLHLQTRSGADPQVSLARIQAYIQSPSLYAAVSRPFRPALRVAYDDLQRHWQVVLQPALVRGDGQRFLQEASAFGGMADRLAQDLQVETARLGLLEMYSQLLSLLVSTSLLLLILYGLRRHAVAPLNKLLEATDRFRAGKLDVRVSHQSQDEFGLLAQGFNAMASDIELSHLELQARMESEMRSLAQANSALALFCSSSRTIAHGETSASDIDMLLQSFQSVLPGLQLTLCLHPVNEHPTGDVISFEGDGHRRVCSYSDCATCKHFGEHNQRIFEVRCQGQVLGELRASFGLGPVPSDWETMLTQALADIIGNALQLGRQREKDNFLLLHNERNTIARELHDSLAQSLSYLQLQVVRLQMLIEREEDLQQVGAVSEALGKGLDEAYRQLRELLTTFRLSMSDADIKKAMKVAAEEFSQRGDFHILLQADELAVPLSAAEEIHLLQILRESLSNCSRHAGAGQVWVQLRQVGEEVELLVEDDGRGFATPDAARQHHGLAIMKERARSIDGHLELGEREPQGGRVRLRFRPRFLAEKAVEAPA